MQEEMSGGQSWNRWKMNLLIKNFYFIIKIKNIN